MAIVLLVHVCAVEHARSDVTWPAGGGHAAIVRGINASARSAAERVSMLVETSGKTSFLHYTFIASAVHTVAYTYIYFVTLATPQNSSKVSIAI